MVEQLPLPNHKLIRTVERINAVKKFDNLFFCSCNPRIYMDSQMMTPQRAITLQTFIICLLLSD